jgi:integrase
VKVLAAFGPKRGGVRVTIEGDLVRVRWRQNGQRKLRSYPNTPENRANAKAYAKGVAESRDYVPDRAPLTLRTLWEKYADAEFPHLRANSQRLYREYYSRWENAWGIHFPVENTTLEMAHTFRRDLTKLGLATSTIRQTVRTVQMVYSWGERNELVQRNRMRLFRFKVSKDDQPVSPAEYRDEDFAKILLALDPNEATQWRAWVALAICGAQGVRQHAVLHLKWTDTASDAGVIYWRKEWDKLGREWSQPMRSLTRTALSVAWMWRQTAGKEWPWILPSGSKKNTTPTYSAQSLWSALRAAEKRAGIPHLKGRGAHGLRRLLAGNVAERTGDAVLAMRSIGDTDVRMANRYLKPREDRIAAVFAEMDEARTAPEATNGKSNETTTAPVVGAVNPLKEDAP